jgi:hypothetical protein
MPRTTMVAGELYKRDSPIRPPKAALDTASRLRLWVSAHQLVGVDPGSGFGTGR